MYKYNIGQKVYKLTNVTSRAYNPRVIFLIIEFEVVDLVSYQVSKNKPPYLAKLVGCKAYNYKTKQFQDFDTRQKGCNDYLRADEIKPTFEAAFEELKKKRIFKLYNK